MGLDNQITDLIKDAYKPGGYDLLGLYRTQRKWRFSNRRWDIDPSMKQTTRYDSIRLAYHILLSSANDFVGPGLQ